MRILHVSDCFLPRAGGIEVTVADLMRQQSARGHDVRLMTLTVERSAPADVNRMRSADRWVSDEISMGVRRPRGTGLRNRLRLIAAAVREADTGGYDAVHAHCSTFSPLAFAMVLRLKRHRPAAPTIITVHSLWRGYTPLYRFADWIVGWSRLPMVWSAVSGCAADAVARAAARDLSVAVLPNGLDLSSWPEPADHVPADHVRLISVMRLAARKRPLALVRMLRKVRRQLRAGPPVSAVIVGDGPWRDRLERYLRRHGMSDWVEITGHLPRHEVAAHLRAADVFIAPASLESFGIAALEAHAAGLIVIGRNGTGLIDYVQDGHDGRLVDGDREMVDAIVDVVRSDAKDTARRIDRPAMEQFTWTQVTQRAEELYELARLKVEQPAAAPAEVA